MRARLPLARCNNSGARTLRRAATAVHILRRTRGKSAPPRLLLLFTPFGARASRGSWTSNAAHVCHHRAAVLPHTAPSRTRACLPVLYAHLRITRADLHFARLPERRAAPTPLLPFTARFLRLEDISATLPLPPPACGYLYYVGSAPTLSDRSLPFALFRRAGAARTAAVRFYAYVVVVTLFTPTHRARGVARACARTPPTPRWAAHF